MNGASIGTETITLTDPNTPSTLKWNFSDKHDGTAEGFGVHDDQTPPCYVEKASDGTWSLTLTGDLANRQDQSPGNNWDYIETTGGTVYLKYKNWDSGGYWSGPYTRAQWSSSIGSETIRIYEHSSYSEQYNNGIYLIQESSSSTPTQPTLITSISLTGGVWNPASYIHQATDTTNTYYEYKISLDTADSQYFIAYNWTTKKWFDTNTATTHSTFGTSVSDTSSTSRETTENPAVVYVMASNALHAQFTNPYYEAPPVVSPLPALSQHTQAFGMEYYQTVGTKYYYKSDSHSGTGTSITYDYETKTWNDEGGQVPYHLNTTSTFASTTSLVNPAEIHGFGSQQNHNGTRYFSVSNPYYEPPAYRTGTSKGFAFTSGVWKNNGYSAIIDDEANSSSGKLVNGVRQFEWDMPDVGGGRLYSGENNWIYFVPGTAEDNGTWYNSSTSTGGTAGTRNGRVISIGTSATFDETNAFVSGLVPYGDIP